MNLKVKLLQELLEEVRLLRKRVEELEGQLALRDQVYGPGVIQPRQPAPWKPLPAYPWTISDPTENDYTDIGCSNLAVGD